MIVAALLAAALGLIASGLLFGSGRVPGNWTLPAVPEGVHLIEAGQTVPAFERPGLNGPSRRLPVLGRPTLINYWASWCEPCRAEMPLLDAYSRENSDMTAEVIGIALDDRADALEFLRQAPVTFPILLEAPSQHDSSVGLGNLRNVLPFTVLIGADGRLLTSHYGAFDDTDALRDWAAQAH